MSDNILDQGLFPITQFFRSTFGCLGIFFGTPSLAWTTLKHPQRSWANTAILVFNFVHIYFLYLQFMKELVFRLDAAGNGLRARYVRALKPITLVCYRSLMILYVFYFIVFYTLVFVNGYSLLRLLNFEPFHTRMSNNNGRFRLLIHLVIFALVFLIVFDYSLWLIPLKYRLPLTFALYAFSAKLVFMEASYLFMVTSARGYLVQLGRAVEQAWDARQLTKIYNRVVGLVQAMDRFYTEFHFLFMFSHLNAIAWCTFSLLYAIFQSNEDPLQGKTIVFTLYFLVVNIYVQVECCLLVNQASTFYSAFKQRVDVLMQSSRWRNRFSYDSYKMDMLTNLQARFTTFLLVNEERMAPRVFAIYTLDAANCLSMIMFIVELAIVLYQTDFQ